MLEKNGHQFIDVSPATRKRMLAVKGRNTAPEIRVRRALHHLGYRFRLHRKELPGTPDIVILRFKKIIFVHGCFWHWHSGCALATVPKSNSEFWKLKLTANRERDARKEKLLLHQGYRVCIIWGCETHREKYLVSKLRRLLIS